MTSQRLHALCELVEGEVPVCFVNIGTVTRHKGAPRLRPLPAAFVSEPGGKSAHGSV